MNEGGPGPQSNKSSSEGTPLREGISSVQVRLIELENHDEELESLREKIDTDEEVAHWVDFEGGDLEALEKEGFKHAGSGSYLISPVDKRDWFSDHYFNCTAVIAFGKSNEDGQEISLLSHQDPNYFIDGNEEERMNFEQALKDSLKELREKSADGTIEVSLAGGNFDPKGNEPGFKNEHYKKSIERLGQIIKETLNFDPKILSGPNNRVGSETVIIVDTQKRKVWIERSKQPTEFDHPFKVSEIADMEERWLKSF